MSILNAEWKKIVTIQLIGYILAIALSPIIICIFEQKLPVEGTAWLTFQL